MNDLIDSQKIMENCTVCPHNCKINRYKNIGFCRSSEKVKIALASLHYYEEPCISGEKGSGTVFFSNCNMRCKYCQNYKISQLGHGKEITVEELADTFIKQQNDGANNINLVTPTMYAYQIKDAIILAKKKGLKIPIVYNSNGYENVETLKQLEGYIDIYLPDLKYYDDEVAFKYSGIKKYFQYATKAILEMYRQVGAPQMDDNGLMRKGMMVRHLVLPNNIENSKKVLRWLKENLDDNVYINVMAQYFPTYRAKEDETINRKLSQKEYDEIEQYVYDLNIKNGYMQELGEHEEEYVPEFE